MQILTAQELHNLAMNIVGEKLREMGYEFQVVLCLLRLVVVVEIKIILV